MMPGCSLRASDLRLNVVTVTERSRGCDVTASMTRELRFRCCTSLAPTMRCHRVPDARVRGTNETLHSCVGHFILYLSILAQLLRSKAVRNGARLRQNSHCLFSSLEQLQTATLTGSEPVKSYDARDSSNLQQPPPQVLLPLTPKTLAESPRQMPEPVPTIPPGCNQSAANPVALVHEIESSSIVTPKKELDACQIQTYKYQPFHNLIPNVP